MGHFEGTPRTGGATAGPESSSEHAYIDPEPRGMFRGNVMERTVQVRDRKSDLLLQFPQRGPREVAIVLGDVASGQRDLAGGGVGRGDRPFDQEDLDIRGTVAQH